ncbi:hypothetical protein SAMN06272775_3439 [Streptomyces sp. 2323.1]|nr:hypothetical protein SAMN05428943_3841 [Streptomyces sp. 2314.4]SOE12446.1 hypothetical protein SAMN06272775_3439 [Streptomyces sp. 2323.1]
MHGSHLGREPQYTEDEDVRYRPAVPGSLHAAQTTHVQNLPSVEIHSKSVRLSSTNQ